MLDEPQLASPLLNLVSWSGTKDGKSRETTSPWRENKASFGSKQMSLSQSLLEKVTIGDVPEVRNTLTYLKYDWCLIEDVASIGRFTIL